MKMQTTEKKKNYAEQRSIHFFPIYQTAGMKYFGSF